MKKVTPEIKVRKHTVKDKKGRIHEICYRIIGSHPKILHNHPNSPIPAETLFYPNNSQVYAKRWYFKNTLHRLNGPAIVSYTASGKLRRQEYYSHGKRHRTNGPAVINWQDGKVSEEIYYTKGVKYRSPNGTSQPSRITYDLYGKIENVEYRNDIGALHKTDGPANIGYYDNGTIRCEEYYVNGNLHRLDGPTSIYYRKNGKVQLEQYYSDDELHRTDGPAEISYHDNGVIAEETYYFEGMTHRTDGPAVITYWDSGVKKYEQWDVNCDLHRVNGPAIILYNKNGKVRSEEFYLNGDWMDSVLVKAIKKQRKFDTAFDQQLNEVLTEAPVDQSFNLESANDA